jgi:hypothetical protein
MAFAMTTLKRLKSGAFTARKTISKDALGECRELLAEDGKSDFMPTSAHRLARLRALNEWLAQIEGRIKAIRDAPIAVGDSPRAP